MQIMFFQFWHVLSLNIIHEINLFESENKNAFPSCEIIARDHSHQFRMVFMLNCITSASLRVQLNNLWSESNESQMVRWLLCIKKWSFAFCSELSYSFSLFAAIFPPISFTFRPVFFYLLPLLAEKRLRFCIFLAIMTSVFFGLWSLVIVCLSSSLPFILIFILLPWQCVTSLNSVSELGTSFLAITSFSTQWSSYNCQIKFENKKLKSKWKCFLPQLQGGSNF